MSSNFHSHCTFCDGHGSPEDFVRSAVSKRFRAYGFSSHSPLPFETGWNMPKKDMAAYIAEINRLKSEYSGKIEIYLGLEIDYLDRTYNAAMPYFQSLPLDYRIGSIHFLTCGSPPLETNCICIDGPYSEFEDGIRQYFDGDIRRAVKVFFENSMQMVEAGGFDIVGHIDKIYMNGGKHPDFDLHAGWYQKSFFDLLDLIAAKALTVEVNCKNMTRKKETFPHRDYYRELKRRNIPVIVNSDCHYTDRVNDGRDETLALLQAIGYQTTRELVGGQWQDAPISV